MSVRARCTEGITGSRGRERADGGGNGDGNDDGGGDENGAGGERTNERNMGTGAGTGAETRAESSSGDGRRGTNQTGEGGGEAKKRKKPQRR